MLSFSKTLILFTCLATMAFSQTSGKNIVAQGYTFSQCIPLEPFSEWSVVSVTSEPEWKLIYQFKKQDEKTSDSAIQAKDAFVQIFLDKLKETHKSKIVKGDSIGLALLLKYDSNTTNVFNGLKLIDNHLSGFLYYTRPINFVSKDNSVLLSTSTVLISAIALGTIFNTQKYSAKERAAQVISSAILPNLSGIASEFSNTLVKNIAVAVIYGSKDFTNEDETLNLEPETVILITPIKICNDFTKGSITEEDLLYASDAYQHSRDSKSLSVNKIKIEIK